MATSNFHNVNASKIFAMTSDSENEFEIDEFAYNDFIDNIDSALSEAGYNDYTIDDPHELRSYPSRVLGSKSKDVCYDHFSVDITIFPVVRSAYYDGCNLDWFLTIEMEGETFNNISEITDENIEWVLRNNDEKHGKKAISNFRAKLTTAAHALKTELETIYKNHTEPLTVVSRFSNGETIYQK